MSQRIRITPEELKGASTVITKKGNQAVELINEVRTQVNNIRDSWEGAAQISFFENFEGMKELFDQFPEIVNGIGMQLNAAAETIETADAEVSKMFKG